MEVLAGGRERSEHGVDDNLYGRQDLWIACLPVGAMRRIIRSCAGMAGDFGELFGLDQGVDTEWDFDGSF